MTKIVAKCLFFFVLFLFVACGNDNEPEKPLNEIPIGFSAYSHEISRSELVGQDKFDAVGSKFIVYADRRYKSSADLPAYDKTVQVFRGQEVVSQGAGKDWTYSPMKFWQNSGAYEFRAAWPSDLNVQSTSTGLAMMINYSLFDDEHPDMMVSYKYREMDNYASEGAYVGLQFMHTLAAVDVIICKEEDDEQEYTLKSTYFKNLYSVGTFVFSGNPQTPDELYDCWNRTNIDGSKIHEQDYNELITAEGNDPVHHFMIPQQTDGNTMKLGYIVNINGNELLTEVNIPSIKWLPGKLYTYKITLKPNGVDIEVVTTQWDNVDVTVDDIFGKPLD